LSCRRWEGGLIRALLRKKKWKFSEHWANRMKEKKDRRKRDEFIVRSVNNESGSDAIEPKKKKQYLIQRERETELQC